MTFVLIRVIYSIIYISNLATLRTDSRNRLYQSNLWFCQSYLKLQR